MKKIILMAIMFKAIFLTQSQLLAQTYSPYSGNDTAASFLWEKGRVPYFENDSAEQQNQQELESRIEYLNSHISEFLGLGSDNIQTGTPEFGSDGSMVIPWSGTTYYGVRGEESVVAHSNGSVYLNFFNSDREDIPIGLAASPETIYVRADNTFSIFGYEYCNGIMDRSGTTGVFNDDGSYTLNPYAGDPDAFLIPFPDESSSEINNSSASSEMQTETGTGSEVTLTDGVSTQSDPDVAPPVQVDGTDKSDNGGSSASDEGDQSPDAGTQSGQDNSQVDDILNGKNSSDMPNSPEVAQIRALETQITQSCDKWSTLHFDLLDMLGKVSDNIQSVRSSLSWGSASNLGEMSEALVHVAKDVASLVDAAGALLLPQKTLALEAMGYVKDAVDQYYSTPPQDKIDAMLESSGELTKDAATVVEQSKGLSALAQSMGDIVDVAKDAKQLAGMQARYTTLQADLQNTLNAADAAKTKIQDELAIAQQNILNCAAVNAALDNYINQLDNNSSDDGDSGSN